MQAATASASAHWVYFESFDVPCFRALLFPGDWRVPRAADALLQWPKRRPFTDSATALLFTVQLCRAATMAMSMLDAAGT